MSEVSPWTPKVLSQFELGKCITAIEVVLRSEKPIAEVAARKASLADLEADLQGCLDFVSPSCDVKFWTRAAGPGQRYRYGFYRDPWVLQAINFLDRAELSKTDRAWISGLLFGYRSRAIQEYIERQMHDDMSLTTDRV